MPSHPGLYELAEYYEIAFDFRDVPAECDFLSHVGRTVGGRVPESYLELAAGPGLHALEFARRGLRVAALDLAPEMVERGSSLARSAGLRLEYTQGDMTDFDLGATFDMAAILMDSTSYLIDNEAVLAHLDHVANHLVEDGVYVLEMGHPRDVFRVGKSTGTDWGMERDGKTVRMKWGDTSDPFDPITQVTETTVTIEWGDGERSGTWTEMAPQRRFGALEFDALVRASGRFVLAERFGAMAADVPFSNEEAAWRMLSVLRRLP